MNLKSTRIVLGIAVPMVLVSLVALSFAVSQNRIADVIAWQWTSGVASSSIPRNLLFGVGGGSVALLSAALIASVFSKRMSAVNHLEWLVFAIAFLGAYVAFQVWEITSANLDLNDWRQSTETTIVSPSVRALGVLAFAIYCGWMASRLSGSELSGDELSGDIE